jgi:SAM-dependent methyltransferase
MLVMALREWTRTFAGGKLSSGMARLNARHPWSHNDHFHGWILAKLPQQRRSALDVGCGHGELVATLSPHFTTVHGNDVDGGMRQRATSRCSGLPNVTIHDGTWTDIPGPFDLVTMIAVLHHLDEADALQEGSTAARARRAVPGGRTRASEERRRSRMGPRIDHDQPGDRLREASVAKPERTAAGARPGQGPHDAVR